MTRSLPLRRLLQSGQILACGAAGFLLTLGLFGVAAMAGEESAAKPAAENAAPATEEPGPQVNLQLMRREFGDKIPDVTLTNDEGKPVKVFTDLIKDRAVVISFFYTNCRGTCPGTNEKLAELRKLLEKDFGRSVRFISVSVEPEHDDVKALAEYAPLYRTLAVHPDTPEWHFLTGSQEDVRSFRRMLGYYEADPKLDADPTQHAAMLVIGNQATGRWAMIPAAFSVERIHGKVERICGWTEQQRYAAIHAALEKQKAVQVAPAPKPVAKAAD